MADSISSLNAIAASNFSPDWATSNSAPRELSPKAAQDLGQDATAVDEISAQQEAQFVEAAALMVFNFAKNEIQRMHSQTETRIKEAQEDEG